MQRSSLVGLVIWCFLLAAPGGAGAGLESWEARAFGDLCVKYLGAAPPAGAAGADVEEWLNRLSMKIGERLAASGVSGAPAEDVALLALIAARAKPGAPPSAPTQPATAAAPGPTTHYDMTKGSEGLRQAQERFAQLPLSDRMVITGDITSTVQAATVPDVSDLASTAGRARVNFVLRAMPASADGRLGEGYFFVQMRAAGGAPDSSAVGGPPSFTAFNDIATARSLFNESTSRGNLYLGKAFYEQRLQLGENHVTGRVGVLDLSDYFDTNAFANNETRQFINSALVNSAAYKTGISTPGIMAAYHRKVRRDWLEGIVFRGAYAVSRTDRAFTSPLWTGEIELQTTLAGRRANWRFGGAAGNRAGAGSVTGFYLNTDYWVTPGVGVFGRYAISNSGRGSLAFGPVRQSYSGGVQMRFVDAENRVSAWSAGFSQSFGIGAAGPLASERVMETYYRWQWTQNLSLTPDFQLVVGSGGRPLRGTHAVFGVRFNVGL